METRTELPSSTPSKLSRKPILITNVIVALLFFLFAGFQFNDVDPAVYHNPSKLDAAIWLLFYFFIGVMSLAVIFRKIPGWILGVGVIACLIQMAISGPGLYQNVFGTDAFNMTQGSMSAEDPRVELSREFFGALIAMLGVAWIWWQRKTPDSKSQTPEPGSAD